MAFRSGRVSFCRFRVSSSGGQLPGAVDEAFLQTLSEHAFRETEIGTPDEIEAGWTTGEHILDTQFSFEKNGFGPAASLALFALRVDTHKVPAEIKQAYRKLNEQAAAEGNPSGFASKAEKREAQDLAGRQIREELASGKFRKSKAVPVLWDLKRSELLCGATTNAAIEALARQFRQSFASELELISSGTLGGHMLKDQGKRRDWEDLHPSAFTDAPSEAHIEGDEFESAGDVSIPSVPWRAQAVDLKDFLGNEFLLWLWWKQEAAEGAIEAAMADGRTQEAFITIDRTLEMECAWGVRGKQSLRGDGPTRLSEAGEALISGKWPRKMGLLVSDGEHQWELTLQGDRMQVSSAALPEIADAQGPRELLEARLELVGQLSDLLDGMFRAFMAQRCDGAWASQRQQMRDWIKQRRGSRASVAA